MENKMVTMREIARRLNISVSSVSRALKDHKSIGLRTKMRVQALVKELGYELNTTAISFKNGKTSILGVILPNITDGFFSSAISGIEDCAGKYKYTVLMGQSYDDIEKEKSLVDAMKSHRVDGVLISIAKHTTNYAHFESFSKYNIPVVFFDRIPNISNIHYVACNLFTGTIAAINYLFKKGHRVIGMINGPEKLIASRERKDGYIEAMTKSRLKFDPSLIVNTDLSSEGVYQAAKELLNSKRKPTAIITFNDYVAMDAITYARSQKLKINKDIAFVSYANEPWNNYTMYPPMASVEQFPYLQGQKATEMLMELINNRDQKTAGNNFKKVILDSELVIKQLHNLKGR